MLTNNIKTQALEKRVAELEKQLRDAQVKLKKQQSSLKQSPWLMDKIQEEDEIRIQKNHTNEPVIVVQGVPKSKYQETLDQKQKYQKLWQDNQKTIQQMEQEWQEWHLTGRQLQDRNFELDQLIHKISMDAKASLASILGLVNLIGFEKDIEKSQQYAKLIENRVLKLDNSMMSMLNFSKANRRKMKYQRVDFNRLINQCLIELQYLKNYDCIQKDIQIDCENPPFICDTLRLRLILSNIISNAIKYQKNYTNDNQVKVHIQTSEKEAVITVTDNGTGIHEDYMDKVFDRFVRANAQSDGSGLGLYIVQKVVGKLGGKIELRSEEMAQTEVKVTIPNRLDSLQSARN